MTQGKKMSWAIKCYFKPKKKKKKRFQLEWTCRDQLIETVLNQ